MANLFTGICAGNAHRFFDTISHTACLKLGGHKHYVPIDQEPVHQSNSASTNRQEADDDVDDGWDIPGAFTIDGEVGDSASEVDLGMDDDDNEEEA